MNKLFVAVSVLAFAVIIVVIVLFSKNHDENKIKQAEVKYADNPVLLYQIVGIKECGYDLRSYKGKHSGSVRLEGDDLNRAIAFLEGGFGKDITAVLYINAPEVSEQSRGQPALLPLKRQGGTYCALGVSGSYSVSIFLEFEKKYQEQVVLRNVKK